MSLANEVVAAIRSVVGAQPVVGLHEPEIGDVEKKYVADCLDSTFVSSVGPFVTRFEEEIAAYTGAKAAVAVSNGTSALQVALFLAGVQAGDEVIVPALSFVATANAISHLGAFPHFVDSSEETLGMDVVALAAVLSTLKHVRGQLTNPTTGRRIAAIVPMHTLGHPVDIDGIMTISREYNIPVVEDAAESLGSFSNGRHTGTFGTLGTLSFNGNKIITTGGGGMILTDDVDLAARAKHLTTTAKLSHEWEFEHDEIAWNYRMPNLNAAMGVAQFTRLEGFRADKRLIAQRYAEAFGGIAGVSFLAEPAGAESNYWLCAIKLDEPDFQLRNELLRAANDDGLRCRPFWNLLSDQRMYSTSERGALENATGLLNSVVCLPSSPRLAGRR